MHLKNPFGIILGGGEGGDLLSYAAWKQNIKSIVKSKT